MPKRSGSTAARGELRRGLPVGLVWGDEEGEVRFHPDESVVAAIRTVFERFAELGSVRQVWLWFRAQGLRFPQPTGQGDEVRWVVPTYTKLHQVLANPVYAGAYVYGKTRHERYVDERGQLRKRTRRLPRAQWGVLLREHHAGFTDWETCETNQTRIGSNIRPRPQISNPPFGTSSPGHRSFRCWFWYLPFSIWHYLATQRTPAARRAQPAAQFPAPSDNPASLR